jgi:hypothetical protein
MINIPANFNGKKFAAKYNLISNDFRLEGTTLFCEKLPNLTDADLLDCITTPAEILEREQMIARRGVAILSSYEMMAQYQAAIDRLTQIETATTFTNAQVIQAIKDMATYEKKIIKVLARMI